MLEPGFAENLKVYLSMLTPRERADLINLDNYQPDPNNLAALLTPMGIVQDETNKKPSKWYYVLEFVFFLIPLGVYIGIYFIQALTGS